MKEKLSNLDRSYSQKPKVDGVMKAAGVGLLAFSALSGSMAVVVANDILSDNTQYYSDKTEEISRDTSTNIESLGFGALFAASFFPGVFGYMAIRLAEGKSILPPDYPENK